MAVKNQDQTTNEPVVNRAQDFWTRNSKAILIASGAVILLAAAYFGYKYLIKEPKENKAAEAIFKAEEYFRMDSLQKALNGDGINPGFIKIIDKYEGTEAGNLAEFYAGAAYVRLGDNAKAVKHLKEFETDAKQVQARAYKLLGDAYADQNKTNDALEAYKKAARHFEDDDANASEYLFLAGYYASRVAKDKEEAVELFKELKKKYSRTQRGFEADKYLAELGVYN